MKSEPGHRMLCQWLKIDYSGAVVHTRSFRATENPFPPMTLTETNFTKSYSRLCVRWHVSDDGTLSTEAPGLRLSGVYPAWNDGPLRPITVVAVRENHRTTVSYHSIGGVEGPAAGLADLPSWGMPDHPLPVFVRPYPELGACAVLTVNISGQKQREVFPVAELIGSEATVKAASWGSDGIELLETVFELTGNLHHATTGSGGSLNPASHHRKESHWAAQRS